MKRAMMTIQADKFSGGEFDKFLTLNGNLFDLSKRMKALSDAQLILNALMESVLKSLDLSIQTMKTSAAVASFLTARFYIDHIGPKSFEGGRPCGVYRDPVLTTFQGAIENFTLPPKVLIIRLQALMPLNLMLLSNWTKSCF